MRHMIETLDRLRPSDHFLHNGKRVLVEHARDLGNGQLELDVADPHGSMANGRTVTVWSGETAEQWWCESGARRGSWRGPLHPSDLAD